MFGEYAHGRPLIVLREPKWWPRQDSNLRPAV
jgi:hypothetical protein